MGNRGRRHGNSRSPLPFAVAVWRAGLQTRCRRRSPSRKAEIMSAENKSDSIRIVITEPYPGAADSLRAALSDTGTKASEVQILGVARDGLEAAQLAVQLSPHIILLHEQLPGMTGYEASGMIALAAPDVAAVILMPAERITEDSLQRALRVGARAVAAEDASPDALSKIMGDLIQLGAGRAEPEYELITDPERMPVMVAVTGAKGGIGKTTIAVNLAVSFAQRYPGQVALVDFYGQYGNIPLMLDLTLQGDIGELAAFAGELDASIIETQLATHESSGLRVLAGTSQSGGLSNSLTPEEEIGFLADMIGIMRRHYRFVFFDVPPLLGQASSYIFSRAPYKPSLSFFRHCIFDDLAQALQTFRQGRATTRQQQRYAFVYCGQRRILILGQFDRRASPHTLFKVAHGQRPVSRDPVDHDLDAVRRQVHVQKLAVKSGSVAHRADVQ